MTNFPYIRKKLLPLFFSMLVGMSFGACQPTNSNPEPTTAFADPTPVQTAQISATKVGAKTPLVVFAAGSLIIPFADIESAFEAKYPDIDVRAEYHGSIQVMRHVTELHEPIDIVATADASLVPMLMYATNNPDTGRPYADWFIRFAGNELVLALSLIHI